MEKPSAVIVETRDHYRFCKRRVGYKGKVNYINEGRGIKERSNINEGSDIKKRAVIT